ncbi:MAG: SlyX family protein [Xanthobacteraceae bacterium]|nr:SlyX family protein [Xanthobacteraceae bacterium]
MSEPASLDVSLGARIDTLEMRVAYQDETIENLNQALSVQWDRIDALKREIARLGDRLAAAEANLTAPPGSEPPPHY